MFVLQVFVFLTIFAIVSSDSYSMDSFRTISVHFNDPLYNFSNLTTPKYANGHFAAVNQFPHQAVLTIQTLHGNTLCGGSLITPFWILSAAHCIIGAKSITAEFGSIFRTSMPLQKRAERALRPSSYNPLTLNDDISLIKLESPVIPSKNIKPIALPPWSTFPTYVTHILRVSGFGMSMSNQIANVLQYTDVIVMSQKECKGYYGRMITSKMICTRGYPILNKGSCNADNGGPLVSINEKPEIVGIVSFGSAQGCAIGAPQVFTRVSSYLKWINSVIRY